MVFNKPSPVQEGSQPYYQCLAASKVIQEEEAGAAELKAEKGRLKPTIREFLRRLFQAHACPPHANPPVFLDLGRLPGQSVPMKTARTSAGSPSNETDGSRSTGPRALR
jgi:hypothetical protein